MQLVTVKEIKAFIRWQLLPQCSKIKKQVFIWQFQLSTLYVLPFPIPLITIFSLFLSFLFFFFFLLMLDCDDELRKMHDDTRYG